MCFVNSIWPANNSINCRSFAFEANAKTMNYFWYVAIAQNIAEAKLGFIVEQDIVFSSIF